MVLGKIDTGIRPLLAAMDRPESALLTQQRNNSGTSESLAPAAQVCLRYKRRRPHPPMVGPNSWPIVELPMSPGCSREPEPQHSCTAPQLTDAIADENAKLTDCYYDKKDWRACKDEVCGKLLNLIPTLDGRLTRLRGRWSSSGRAGRRRGTMRGRI